MRLNNSGSALIFAILVTVLIGSAALYLFNLNRSMVTSAKSLYVRRMAHSYAQAISVYGNDAVSCKKNFKFSNQTGLATLLELNSSAGQPVSIVTNRLPTVNGVDVDGYVFPSSIPTDDKRLLQNLHIVQITFKPLASVGVLGGEVNGEIWISFLHSGSPAVPIGPRKFGLTLNLDTTGKITGCSAVQSPEQICLDMGGIWNVIETPPRCYIKPKDLTECVSDKNTAPSMRTYLKDVTPDGKQICDTFFSSCEDAHGAGWYMQGFNQDGTPYCAQQ